MEAVPIEVNFIGKEWILSMIDQTKQNNGKLTTTALIATISKLLINAHKLLQIDNIVGMSISTGEHWVGKARHSSCIGLLHGDNEIYFVVKIRM